MLNEDEGIGWDKVDKPLSTISFMDTDPLSFVIIGKDSTFSETQLIFFLFLSFLSEKKHFSNRYDLGHGT